MAISDGAALNRWRLVLGKQAEGELSLHDLRLSRMDDALDFLYGREAGADVRHGLIGAGNFASHGYERSHMDGVYNTPKVRYGYLEVQ